MAAAQPGPMQAYFLAQTLRWGWWRTLPLALAPLISDGPIIALVLFVLTQVPAWFLNVMQLGGGFFLLYLAWGTFRAGAASAPAATTAGEGVSAPQGIWQAAAMNLLNPNPYIFWSTVTGPILLAGWRESAVSGSLFLLGFYGALVSGFAGFITLFAVTKRLDPRLNRVLQVASALALLLFGLWYVWLGVTAVFA